MRTISNIKLPKFFQNFLVLMQNMGPLYFIPKCNLSHNFISDFTQKLISFNLGCPLLESCLHQKQPQITLLLYNKSLIFALQGFCGPTYPFPVNSFSHLLSIQKSKGIKILKARDRVIGIQSSRAFNIICLVLIETETHITPTQIKVFVLFFDIDSARSKKLFIFQTTIFGVIISFVFIVFQSRVKYNGFYSKYSLDNRGRIHQKTLHNIFRSVTRSIMQKSKLCKFCLNQS